MFVQSIRPTDEELFQRYNPELQRRSIEEGPRRAQEFVDYTNKLKEWSKSDKSSTWPSLYFGRDMLRVDGILRWCELT